jgi:hypothetical protein
MKLDSAFQIGKTHDICQDFALTSKDSSPLIYTVVSDGCSASLDSDVGSRVLACTATQQLEHIVHQTDNLSSFNPEVGIVQAGHACDALNLSRRAADATLLIAAVINGRIQIRVLGDGTVAIGTKDGEIVVIDFEYTGGYPFYMSYLPECSKDFLNWNKKYSQCEITVSIIKKDEIDTFDSFSGDNDFFTNSADKPSLLVLGSTYDKKITIGDYFDKVQWVSLMSDGVHSFYETQNLGTSIVNADIDYLDVITEALNFKNFNGKFMQRRLNRFLKFCQKNNWHHADDISFGTIYFGS